MAAAAVVDMVVVIVGHNPSAEGVAVFGAGSGTGPTAELLSRARAGREVGFDLVSGLGFEFFDSKASSLYDLIFLEVLFSLFLFLFFAPLTPVVVAAVSTVGFTT